MDFTISDELGSVGQLARQILGDFTEVDKLKAIEATEERFDRELWQALAEAGLLGVDQAEAHGGMDMGFFALSVLCEEVGRTVAPVPAIPVLVGAAGTLRRFGTDAQKDSWLPGIVSGKTLVTSALEETGNDDPANPGAVAEAVEGGYAVTGGKICVVNAPLAERVLVSARAGEELVVLLIDPKAAGASLNPQIVTSGETRHELAMNKVQVPGADVVATGSEAIAAMNWARNATRTGLASYAVGLCDQMMRITGQYTSEREQFGRAIATFQAVSHRVADCYIDVECLRLVTQQAASLLDQGRDAEDEVLMAKIWCGDVSHRVSQASQHCHGGTGVDRDYHLFRYCLAARQIELSAGNSAALTGKLGENIRDEYRATA